MGPSDLALPMRLGSKTGIPAAESYPALAALEPAEVGTQRILPDGIPGATNDGPCLVVRYASGWSVPSSDSVARAYMAANPIPNLSPKADYTYILPSSALWNFDTIELLTTRTSYKASLRPSGPANTFNGMQVGIGNNTTNPFTINRVFAMRSGNTNTAVTENPATGLVTIQATPIVIAAGTDLNPKWHWFNSVSLGTVEDCIVLFEAEPGAPLALWGDYGWEGIGWAATQEEVLSTNLSSGISFAGANCWGKMPAIAVKFTGLSTPVCWLPFVGDSWPDGYGDGPGPRRPVGLAGRLNARWSAASQPIAPMIFARSGFTTTQSVARLQNLLANFDVRAAVVQFNSLNNVFQDVPSAQCQTDWLAVEDAMGSRKLLPLVGGATATWPSGGFAAWKANSDWMAARNPATNVDIYDSCVSPTTGAFGAGLFFTEEPNPSHLNLGGFDQWDADAHANMRAVLAGWGV
jgi:hypothetical protein